MLISKKQLKLKQWDFGVDGFHTCEINNLKLDSIYFCGQYASLSFENNVLSGNLNL